MHNETTPGEPTTQEQAFTADLANLTKAGKEHLPEIGNEILTANNHLADTAGLETLLTVTPDRRMGDFSAVEAWNCLRDDLMTVTGRNGERMYQTAHAVLLCVSAYVEADTVNEDALKKAVSDRGLSEKTCNQEAIYP